MIGRVTAKYALRSLLRHPRRTALSVLGVGLGCAIGLFAKAWYGGATQIQIRAVAESGGGHLRVVAEGWKDERENSMRLVNWRKVLAAASAHPGVKTAVPRARVNGLLAMGNRTAGVQVTGVDPEVELASNRLVNRAEIEGRYLRKGDAGKVVVGKAVARRLDVELDDDLLLTVSGREEIQSAMLRIVGIASTGSRELDEAICHVAFEDVERMTGYDGAGDVSILLRDRDADNRLVEKTRASLAETLPEGNEVITWMDVNLMLAANVESDTAFINFMIFIIVIVVGLGIASAQLTAVLERRREFAILTALGMKARQVTALIMLEGVLTGVAGAAVALLIAGPFAYLMATRGVDLSSVFGDAFMSVGGVLWDPVLYGSFGMWLVWYALAICVAATVVASLYPAWFAVKTDPADALRV